MRMAEQRKSLENTELLNKLREYYDLEKVKKIAPDDGLRNEDWLVIFWEDLQFGVVNIDSTYSQDKVELKSGHELTFGENMYALYGPEMLKAIFITRAQTNGEEAIETSVHKSKEKKAGESLDEKLKIKKKGKKIRKKADLRGKVAFETAKSMFSQIKNVHDKVEMDTNTCSTNKVENNTNSHISSNKNSQSAPPQASTNTDFNEPTSNSQSLDNLHPVRNSQSIVNHGTVTSNQSCINFPLTPLMPSSTNSYNMQTNIADGPCYNNQNTSNMFNHYKSFSSSMYPPYHNFHNYLQPAAPLYNTPYQDKISNRNLHFPQPLRPLQSYSSSNTLFNPYKLLSLNQDEEINDNSLSNSNAFDSSTISDDENENSYQNLSINPENDEAICNFTSNFSPTSDNFTSNPVSGLDNSNNCMLCLEKDPKIKSLTLQLTNCRQQLADTQHDNKKVVPEPVEGQLKDFSKRTRGRLKSTDYKVLSENTSMPPGYQYLVEGSPLVVRSDWLKDTLFRLRQKDRSCALKMIVDCLMSPEEYGVRGGTTGFSKSPLAAVMASIESFGLVHFKMLPTDVTRALNETMYSGRKILKKREQDKERI